MKGLLHALLKEGCGSTAHVGKDLGLPSTLLEGECGDSLSPVESGVDKLAPVLSSSVVPNYPSSIRMQ